MADIKDTRSKFHDRIGRGFDIPSEHVESEGERLIKYLAQRQTNTQLKLTDELKRESNFQNPTKCFPLTEFASGEVKLKQFKEINKSVLNLENLYACGLTDDEVNLYTDSLKGFEFMRNKYKNLQLEILNDRLNNIFEKINNKSLSKNSTNHNLQRQQYELGLCVKPNSKETKLYKFALSCQNNNNNNTNKFQPLEHPINNLKEIEHNLFKHLKSTPVPSVDKRRKRVRKILAQDLDDNLILKLDKNECSQEKISVSKWDMQEIPVKKEKIYTCAPPSIQNSYTIENNQIVLVNDRKETDSKNKCKSTCKGLEFVGVSHTPISIDHIKRYKLSLEDIKKISKFQNYECGTPNKILFAKNLPSNLSENDLIQIFKNFEKPDNKISYKIMNGRMKGQAFITFPDEQQAKEALETVNGYLLHGQPIILQYGHRKV